MTRLYNFERKEYLTDIGGNLYNYDAIIAIIERLSCFGLTLQQLREKRKLSYEPKLHKLVKRYKEYSNKPDEEYDKIEEKYNYVKEKFIELNPEFKDIWSHKRHFEPQEHYTREQKEWVLEQKKLYDIDMLEYYKVEKEQEKVIDEYNRVFDTENKGLWTEIVFFKFVKKINTNKYLVEVSPFMYRDNLNSCLKVGDQITIQPMDINFLNPMDKVIEKYRLTHFSQIHINLPIITDWSGYPYRNRDTVTNFLEYGDIVRIQIKMEDINENKIRDFCWYLQILNYDTKK